MLMFEYGEFNDKAKKLASRFYEMKRHSKSLYFDVEEFEEIANHYLEKQKLPQADEAINYGLSIHPSALSLKVWYAKIQVKKGNYKYALGTLASVASIEYNNSDLQLLTGECHAYLKHADKAREAFDAALTVADNEEKKLLYYRIGLVYENLQDYTSLAYYLQKAHEEYPDDLQFIHDLAIAYEKTGNHEQSTIFFDKYVNKDPFSETAWFNMGVTLSKQGIFDAAAQANDFAIAIAPEYPEPYFNKGRNLYLLQEYDEAIESFLEFLRFKPGNLDALQCLGECYEQIEDYSNALKYYNQAIERDDRAHEAHVGIATVKLQQGEYEDACRHIAKAIEEEADNAYYWFINTNLCMHLGNYTEADRSFEKVVAFQPKNHIYWLNYADLLFANDAEEDAIAVLKRALAELPDNPMLNYRLAAYLFLLERNSEAQTYLKAAFNTDPQASHYFTDIYADEDEHIDVSDFLKGA